ncbi:MAG: ABC transporter ATP-binding protein [Candidatus Altiarchaeota archaeon]
MDRKDLNLKVEGLHVSYAGLPVLEDLNLKVKEGEFVSIIGESGCGKTTLLNAIAGFIGYRGTVKRPERIGVVFQNHAVFPWLTVKDNIAFGLKDGKTAEHYLKTIGLEDKASHYPHQLSGGQVQRVALARTMAADPDLILMDEPYGALDVYTREKMQQWLLGVWERERKTILFVTHSIEEAAFLSDRILLMKNKKICGEYPIGHERPRSKELRFTKDFIELKKNITEALNVE